MKTMLLIALIYFIVSLVTDFQAEPKEHNTQIVIGFKLVWSLASCFFILTED